MYIDVGERERERRKEDAGERARERETEVAADSASVKKMCTAQLASGMGQ